MQECRDQDKTIPQRAVFFNHRSQDWELSERIETCSNGELWFRKPRWILTVNTYFISNYQCFHSFDRVNVDLVDSFSKSMKLFCGTLIEEIKRPFMEENGSDYAHETKVSTQPRVSDVSQLWSKNQAMFDFNCKIIHIYGFFWKILFKKESSLYFWRNVTRMPS